MTTDIEADQKPLRDTARAFLDRHASSEVVHRLAANPGPLDRTFWRAAAEMGWTALLVPEAAGGGSVTGQPFRDVVALAAECGRRVAPGPLAPANVVAHVLSNDADVHGDVLGAILDGSAIAAWAVFEGNGWAPADVTVCAEARGDGFVLTGTKRFVEGAPDADVLLVTARTVDGLAHFIVETDAPGVTVTARHGLDPLRSIGDVEFGGATVPRRALVGGGLSGDELAERALCTAIAIQAAETAASMRHVFDMTLEWVGQRYAFGRVIGSYQALKHRLAEHLLAVECAEGVVNALAAALDSGAREVSELASTAKAHIGEASVVLISDAVQMHGGIGMTWEHDLHLHLRRASANRVLYGSPAQHRDRLCTLAGM